MFIVSVHLRELLSAEGVSLGPQNLGSRLGGRGGLDLSELLIGLALGGFVEVDPKNWTGL